MIERKVALKLWEERYGKSIEATDFAGRKMNKSAYDQKNSKFGWTVTYLLPRSAGGKSETSNLLCVHTETAREKGEDYPYFTAVDTKYEITYLLEEGDWVIAKPNDDASIAEAEAKIAAAKAVWDGIFSSETATDFAGREIHRDDYMGQGEYAWKTAPYVDSKPAEGKNLYIASLVTVEETLGKTAFKANGKNFTLNKENGSYHFKELEAKPPKKEYDVKNPYDVAAKISAISNACLGGESVMMDFVVIRAVTNSACTASNAQAVTDTVNAILEDMECPCVSSEVSEAADEQGARYMFITLRYVAANPADFERIFNGAQLLNNYSTLIMPMLGLAEFKVYNYAEFMSRAHIRCAVGMLCSYYPQFAAFMDCIYKSTDGFYHSEPSSTLYVSNMIIVNIPSLLAVHPQETEQFYTPVYLAEHNLLDLRMMGVIQNVLSGVPNPDGGSAGTPEKNSSTDTNNARANTAETNDISSTIAPGGDDRNGTDEARANTAETNDASSTIAPINGETDQDAPAEDTDEGGVWVATEADDEDSDTQSEYDEDDDYDCIDEDEDDSYIDNADDDSDSASDISDSASADDSAIAVPPQGEQLTMAFPTMTEDAEDDDEDDSDSTNGDSNDNSDDSNDDGDDNPTDGSDDIFTFELDSFNN